MIEIVYRDRETIVSNTLYTDGEIETVTVGELVRCKDCKNFDPQYPGMSRGDCKKDNLSCPYDWDYCSRGERKDGKDEA